MMFTMYNKYKILPCQKTMCNLSSVITVGLEPVFFGVCNSVLHGSFRAE